MEKKVIFTGGGSAGHVTPNLALMRTLQAEGIAIHYIGTKTGMERALVESEPNVCYHSISAGKLRRYISLKNIADVFQVLRGIGQSRRIVKRVKPDLVFSKGGFVTVPAVIGARGLCPIIVHESDYTPGLANRIANRLATSVCVTFEDTKALVGNKGVFTGTPIRKELYGGDRARGFSFTGLKEGKPVLMMMGGGQGAEAVNKALRSALDTLLSRFQIVHLCGKGKLDESAARPGYVQYEYVSEQLPDLFSISDILLARAGANSIFEFLALKKPALLVPLPLCASRGDQIQNAQYFKKKGYADVLYQQDITPQTLSEALFCLYDKRASYIAAMQNAPNSDGTQAVLGEIRAKLNCARG